MSNHQDALGLPDPRRGGTPLEAPVAEVDGYEYVLPASIIERREWLRHGAGKFTERDLTVVMVEPSSKDEADASKMFPNNPVGQLNRLERYCIYKIGDRLVRRNEQLIDSYYKAIGRTGRAILEQIFLKHYQVDPAEVEAVIAEGKPVTV